MVGNITQIELRGGRVDGFEAVDDNATSQFSLGRNASFKSGSQDQHFLEQKGDEFRKLIDDVQAEASSNVKQENETIAASGVFSLFAQQAPLVPPANVAQFDPSSSTFNSSETIERITKLVRDFNLRDPLLASQSLSCSVNFAEGFSVSTAVVMNGIGELQVRLSTSVDAFRQRAGLPIESLKEALEARFPRHRLRIEFVGEDPEHA